VKIRHDKQLTELWLLDILVDAPDIYPGGRHEFCESSKCSLNLPLFTLEEDMNSVKAENAL